LLKSLFLSHFHFTGQAKKGVGQRSLHSLTIPAAVNVPFFGPLTSKTGIFAVNVPVYGTLTSIRTVGGGWEKGSAASVTRLGGYRSKAAQALVKGLRSLCLLPVGG